MQLQQMQHKSAKQLTPILIQQLFCVLLPGFMVLTASNKLHVVLSLAAQI